MADGGSGSGGEPPYAHSLPGEGRAGWEPLPEHLLRVATLAGSFAAVFGAERAAVAVGLLHDIGKLSADFQTHIRNGTRERGPDHSTAGAVEVQRLFPGPLGRLLAFCIAGHHGGLPDGEGFDTRLARELPPYDGWQALVPSLPVDVTPSLRGGFGDPGYALAFLGRMIFSCLVDADSLETRAFYDRANAMPVAPDRRTSLVELRGRLDRRLAKFGEAKSDLDRQRKQILDHARAKAALAPGLFTMTVPTGGGKTLAGLAFALDHAIAHGLRRVVYVIPYTSIIEQTADVFRTALADADGKAPDVLEHHGNFDWDPKSDRDDPGATNALARLRSASENWDIPIVVTTAVQFFESLYANRRSRCRKLHNLANSVVVLDEAQTLPLPLLRPCMAAIGELARSYGASAVLCTATQPALRRQDGFDGGFDIPAERELASDPAALYDALKRVTVEHVGSRTDAEIAERFAEQPRLLCIVNSRRHAQELFAAIADQDGARHLTTLMCPAHRRKVLAESRAALKDQEPVRLVATSLIEAGVDVDFPEVWRAETGLDSIAQAAGRCNREGELASGRVVVFESADHKLPAMFRQQVDAMQAALRAHGDDPLGLDAVRTYFRQLYWVKGDPLLDAGTLGKDGPVWPILPALHASLGADLTLSTPYESVAKTFRIIDDVGKAVIVQWRGGEDPGEVERLLATLKAAPKPPVDVVRKLQQYTVTIPERSYAAMLAVNAVQPVAPEYGDRFMVVQDMGTYSEKTGLLLDPFGGHRDLTF